MEKCHCDVHFTNHKKETALHFACELYYFVHLSIKDIECEWDLVKRGVLTDYVRNLRT